MKQRLFIIVLLVAPVLWMFGGSLVSDEMFVFRDAAHYYYPYYHYVAEQWGEGLVPLWNPLENLGQPLLADPTSAVLYPGKLIFISPLGYDTNYKLYIVGHVLLAAINAFLAARGFARSQSAATICALSYAFSGAVVFQYCNVVFLVGAAWLPLAVLATDRMLAQRSWRWAVGLAVVLAMIVLGGDPQMAYHVMLLAALYVFMLWRSERRRKVSVGRSSQAVQIFLRPFRRPWKAVVRTGFRSRPALLVAAAGLAFTLAAAQIIPSMQWTRHTTRAATDVPRNVYELATGAGERDLPASQRVGFLLGQTDRGHHEDSYLFSVGPWHLAGYVWPNVFGNVFPENTRWIKALPAEDRMWTPTLYMGLLPLLLGLSQLAFRSYNRRGNSDSQDERRQRVRRVWLTWMAILALLASFGWYGIGWVASEIYHATCSADAEPLAVGWPFGGVYWLLQTLLPGYVYFRYPAKWLVVSSMGLAMLAAYGWDNLISDSDDRPRRFVRRALLIVLGLSMVAGVVAKTMIFDYRTWEQICRLGPADPLFGPLETVSAGWNVITAIVHTILLTTVYLWLIPRPPRAGHTNFAMLASWRGRTLLVLFIVDLCIAQRGFVPTERAVIWRRGTAVESRLQRHRPDRMERRCAPPVRLYRQIRSPFARPSNDRQRAGLVWDQATFLPKYQLLDNFDLLESSATMASLVLREFMTTARRQESHDGDGLIPDISLLESVSTEYVVAEKDAWPDELPRIRGPQWTIDWFDLIELAPQSRARVVYDVERLPVLESPAPCAIRQRTEAVLLSIGDGGLSAMVETNRPLAKSMSSQPASSAPSSHPCTILSYTSQRVELWATLKQDGLVVLADAYEENWVCEVTDLKTGQMRREPILRTNRVMRGVWLPAGDYKLVFRYRPLSFYWGAALSGVGWLNVLILLVCGWAARQRRASLPVG